MSTRRVSNRTTPRRAPRTQRSSNSSNSSSGSALSNKHSNLHAHLPSGDVATLKRSLANYSPESEALSLTDETELDERWHRDEDTYEDGEDGEALEVTMGPEELDEEWFFEPKPGDAVWVKSKDTERETWYRGLVQKSTRSGTVRGGKQGTFYSVRYHRNVRRYFAPLLGDIKPDTPRVRRLLEQAGCDLEL